MECSLSIESSSIAKHTTPRARRAGEKEKEKMKEDVDNYLIR